MIPRQPRSTRTETLFPDTTLFRSRLNTLHSLAQCWRLPRLPGFLSAHPDIRISLDTGMSLARFDDGGPDLAIRHGPGHWPGLRARYLMDDALFPVAAPSLRGVDGIANPADLLAFPLARKRVW